MTDSSEPDSGNRSPPSPEIRPRSRLRVSLVWLVPLVAALVGLGLVVRSVLLSGPTITISFKTAQGLEQGKTEVKYKNVVVGKVHDISLDNNFNNVLVTVELTRRAAGLAVEDTRFWVVRPRVDWGGVSGLNTLLSGAYIGVDIGTSKQPREHFVGMDDPPAITHDQHGTKYVLHADDLGSLNIGSPVYYRKIAVGRVAADKLDDDGQGVTLEVFVKAPYDKFVTRQTRFWNASGVDLSLNAGGLTLNTQSLITVLAGGIAFEPLPGHDDAPHAPADSKFTLYSDRGTALAPTDGPPEHIRMDFHQSIKGLSVGADVNFRGIDFGHVTAVNLHYDPDKTDFWAEVDADIYPDRLGPAQRTIEKLGEAAGPAHEQLMANMVKHGLRAQLRTGNLITGQLYVALDFMHGASPVEYDPHLRPIRIPTVKGSLEQIQTQISEIVRKLNDIPFDRIGNNLNATLRSANALLQQLDGHLAPQAQATLEQVQHTLAAADRSLASGDSPLQQNARRTLSDVQRAARAMGDLADYLQRHPEALIRGRGGDDTPPPEPPFAAAPAQESP